MSRTDRNKRKQDPAAHWRAERAEAFLRRVGIREGMTVLDFGCHKGNYTCPAARVVGTKGHVYGVDKDKKTLRECKAQTKRKGLKNLTCIHLPQAKKLPFQSRTMDMVLLFDVLHGGYLPELSDRMRVLREIHRVLKPNGKLAFYPTHIRQFGLTLEELMREATASGFVLLGEHKRRLVHDGRLVRGRVFDFRRGKRAAARRSGRSVA